MTTFGFATYRDAPDLTDDDRHAAAALAARGVEVVSVPWDGPAPARPPDAIVIRSCWNYHLAPDAFLGWVRGLDVPVTNPPDVIAWNLDKRYLRRFEAAIPTTVWVDAPCDLAALLEEHGLDEVVVKPAISLSAYQTWRTRRADARAHQADLDRLVAAGVVLVQRFVPEVTTAGELSFVFLGGEYSHAVLKRPRAGDFRVQMDHGGTREPATPPGELLEQAQAIVAAAPGPLTYARVDGVDVGGRLVLMELELIDPVLFFAHAPGAAGAFADALLG